MPRVPTKRTWINAILSNLEERTKKWNEWTHTHIPNSIHWQIKGKEKKVKTNKSSDDHFNRDRKCSS